MADEKKDPKPAGEAASKGPAIKRPRLVIPPGLEPVYANVVRIAHTPSEIVFDFGQLLPGDSEAPIKSRVLMSPLSAKLLQRALTENIAKFESNFGEITIPRGKSLADNLFRTLQPPEEPKDDSEE
ncbi:MAG: DUF3467 domain-containing protein [Chloroflexi bacterium]|nr:DUF3467 domain-containing protein [Chloroflexota bacterium]